MLGDYFAQFLLLAGAGIGLCAAGVANLVCARRPWLRAGLTLGACGAVAAGLAAVASVPLGLSAGGLALGGAAAVAALGSDALARRVVAAGTALRRPPIRWGLGAACGVATVIAAALVMERADADAIDATMEEMALVSGRPASHPVTGFKVATDRGTAVVPKAPDAARDAAALAGPEERMLEGGNHDDHVIRLGPPDERANCHGWVFTGGRYLLGPDDVELILKENGYTEVSEPQPGDLVVYRQGGTVAHTAVVRYVTEGQPVLVAGKWGALGVFLHAADKSCYGPEYTFHRSARRGHLLVGLGGEPGSPGAPAVATDE